MATEQNSQYWQKIISALDKQIAETGAAIAALAERKAPLCLAVLVLELK